MPDEKTFVHAAITMRGSPRADMEALLEGGSTERAIDENVVLSDLATRPEAVWSLLLFSGYLKAEEAPGPADESPLYRLSIPNREVRQVYTSTFRDWMREQLGGQESDVDRLKAALLSGDAEALEEQLGGFTASLLSYHDTKLRPEQVYQAFVIGLLATMEPYYRVRSNRESGQGRPDVAIFPRSIGKPGALLEFDIGASGRASAPCAPNPRLKVARPGKKTPAQALKEGLSQIAAGDYAAELRAVGADPVHAFVVAFDGKRVWVRSAGTKASKATASKAKSTKATASKAKVSRSSSRPRSPPRRRPA